MNLNYKRIAFLCLIMKMLQFSLVAQCIEGDGNISINSINIDAVKNIRTNVALDLLRLNENAEANVVVNGDANVLAALNVYTLSDTLIIEFPFDSCFINYALTIDVDMPSLENLNFNGLGEVLIGDFTTSTSLKLESYGTGNISIAQFHNALDLEVYNYGNSTISMYDDFPLLQHYKVSNRGAGDFLGCLLVVDSCEVENFGAGLVAVNATDYLKASLAGVGSLEYYGEPELDITSFGLVQVIAAEDANCMLPTAIRKEILAENTLSVYPNPCEDRIKIQGIDNKIDLVVSSFTGQIMEKYFAFDTSTSLDVSGYPSGVYFVKTNSTTTTFVKH